MDAKLYPVHGHSEEASGLPGFNLRGRLLRCAVGSGTRLPKAASVFALLVSCASSLAQDVRDHVRFGMTEAEARLALKPLNRFLDRGVPQKEHPQMYGAVALAPIDINGLHGETDLLFSKPERRLVWVNTKLYQQKGGTLDEFENKRFGIISSLITKYGIPTEKEGCTGSDADCTVIWAMPAQRIELLTFVKGVVLLNYWDPRFRDRLK